jgi:hypothetical protein
MPAVCRAVLGEADQRAQLEQTRTLASRHARRLTEARCRRICRRALPPRQLSAQPVETRLEPAFAGALHERQRFRQGRACLRQSVVLQADFGVEGEHVVHAFEHGDVAPLLQDGAHAREAIVVAARGGAPAGEGPPGPPPVVDAAVFACSQELQRPPLEESRIAALVRDHAMRPQHLGDGEGLPDRVSDGHSRRQVLLRGLDVAQHDRDDGRVVAAGDSRILAEHDR